jgi:hypothetical protein
MRKHDSENRLLRKYKKIVTGPWNILYGENRLLYSTWTEQTSKKAHATWSFPNNAEDLRKRGEERRLGSWSKLHKHLK